MKRLFLTAILLTGLGANIAHAYVNLYPVANNGGVVTSHGVNPTGMYLRCNLLETSADFWGNKYTNVLSTWDFAPYQTRVFNLPNNPNYYNFQCFKI